MVQQPSDDSCWSAEDPKKAHSDEAVTIDAYFGRIGEFGRYQRSHYAVVAGAWVACAWITFSMVFVNARPAWLAVAEGTTTTPCDDPDAWTIADTAQSVGAEWRLVCADGYRRASLDSLYFLGFLIGASALGAASDRYGRRKACAVSAGIAAGGSLASAFAPSFGAFAVLRFLAGIGVGGLGSDCYVLASEFIGPSWQSRTGNAQAAIFAVGGTLLAPVALCMPGWRSLALVSALPAAAYVPVFLLGVAESPRWLLAQGRADEAARVLLRVGVVNGATAQGTPPPKLATSGGGGGGGGAGAQTSGRDEAAGELRCGAAGRLCSTAALRRRTGVMVLCWFAASFSYYGLSLNAGNLEGLGP